MDLSQRRAVQAFQDGPYQGYVRGVQDALGSEVAVEVDWEAIAGPGEAEHYLKDSYWMLPLFRPVLAGLRRVASDEMGQEALRKGLTRIVFTFDPNTAPASNYPMGLTFADGVLTVNWRPWANAGPEGTPDFDDRVAAVATLLESRL